MDDAASRLDAIEERNSRVEADKAWETSGARRLSIAALILFIAVAYGYATGADHPWLNAVIPPLGYLGSTITITWAKKRWLARYRRTPSGRSAWRRIRDSNS